MSHKIEMIGHRFGRLVVLEQGEPKGRQPRWICRCDCGAERLVHGTALRGGKDIVPVGEALPVLLVLREHRRNIRPLIP